MVSSTPNASSTPTPATASDTTYWQQVRDLTVEHLAPFAAEYGARINLDPSGTHPYDFYFTIENIHFPDGIGHGTLRVMGYPYGSRNHVLTKFRSNRKWAGYDLNPDRGEIVGEKSDSCPVFKPRTMPTPHQLNQIVKNVTRALRFQQNLAKTRAQKGNDSARFINSKVVVHPKHRAIGSYINS